MFLKGYDIPALKKFDIFITKREGGESEGKYASLNLGVRSGDERETVENNRKTLAGVLWRSVRNFTYLNQVHGSDVLILKDNITDREKGEYDAVITNKRTYIPTILVADCVPIVVFDEKKEVFGAIHSGWRGADKNILKNTLDAMQKHFDCDIQNIQVIIGPCISAKNYEVDEKVIEYFDSEFYNENDKGGYQLDLRKCVESQAKNAGCDIKNISHIDNCTFTEKDTFFSARRDGIESGRFAMGIYAK